ncbi:hypothetical protein EUTSA_v10014687mg [Eutrema salsugineum]|uniref:Uncharacterized protein n=1 Tax=Eutrema salsugineum TaxID=72664 RepID=V4KVD4_EUTSA|nr:uncharacterized protein LOC18018556 [Eutrema salsugineum]ESQ41940.1 hypothetical protein EUTSA_v10014687mg [Eutrema salsugineum]
MSRMRSSYLKPPLPKSPIRLRSRQVNSSSSLQTPPGLTKFQKSVQRLSGADLESKLPIEYSSISSEIHALAKMVEKEFAEEEDLKSRAAGSNLENLAANSVPVFERGRFYEEYSAKRNERLRRKRGGGDVALEGLVKATPYNLGVNHEPMTTKRRGGTTSKKKAVSMVETTPRYSLRSMTKENRKPPLPLNVTVSAMKTVTTRKGRRI